MSNLVVIDGDALTFNPQFGAITITPPPQPRISGSGEASIGGKKICIVGDEKQVSFTVDYIKPPFIATPGKGTLTIKQLASDQRAEFATAPVPMIVVGSQFTTQFQPTTPAQDPQGKPDPNMGPTQATGEFINSQSFVTAG
ncbi:hypothetical protein [Serratia plymuthica]|uniref:Uncharacterized protein n=1 Tax=Serratia plymuthica TaxID=82996 RepID=A0A2X4UY87_SERPL|nr:hypothetical protein [Serratia plymuthica]QPS20154.1 hypothetical protein I6G64_21755 [Serratia plymuthica]QPS57756.1 hypothetical protein I6G53_09745 [Serratia plymuthica]QPS61769.1 hypothetical protein I6G52_17015 [Serratia plymuthica]RKS61143.1 hypothetical protein C8E17_0253 [Serratia plymuthica]UNK29929.1 hypothetical protein MNO11_09410 [Serratia plymuthica]